MRKSEVYRKSELVSKSQFCNNGIRSGTYSQLKEFKTTAYNDLQWKIWKKCNKIHNVNESVSISRQWSIYLYDNSTTGLDELFRDAGNNASGHDE